MEYLQGLNEPQRQAVTLIDRPLLVLAGAGSGKTTVIARKIAHLLTQGGYDAAHIAAVTFTNKAAREMRERVATLVPAAARRGLTVLTFHALGLRIIRAESETLGLRPGFTLLDPHDAEAVIKELCRTHLGSDKDYEAVNARVRAWKDASIDPATAILETPEAGTVYSAYQEQLRAYNAVDLDDLILKPAQLLATDKEARARWREQLRYLLVDEYQDTNDGQYRLARALAGTAFTAVGDDDQSVYSWRGARPENLHRLVKDYPDLAVIKLEQNYRSSGRILKAANAVIDNNPHLFPKQLWSTLGFGEPIRVLVSRDETHEAERVVMHLLHDKFTRKGAFEDYTILYRSNHQARPFEQVLREHRVPYVLTGGTSFFDRVEVRDAVAYLRLLHNPADNAAFLRICNVPKREIGAATIERLRHYAERRQQPLLACCHELGLASTLSSQQAAALRAFAVLMDGMREKTADRPPGALLRELLAEIAYEEHILQIHEDGRAARRRIEGLQEFLAFVDHVGREETGRNLGDVVSHLILAGMGDKEESGQAGVRLMTLHAAKGLEFPHVFLAGMEEDILPHHASLGDDGLEEERRLAYVGMTRARFTLTLSLARRRRRQGEIAETSPSRFIGEIPEEHLLWDGREDDNPEERQQRGASHIAGLRGLLGG
ncbi:MAG: UvrD-helicase domain-containing protein [Gammaproteobacteria bacterium]|nr:UvrD-helicase domain-containing protein [Gammaproteobacteria bacterium]